ncbi:hypothetical protein CCACVL1_17690 [Corchorus capsularis]|uniref:Uncharacterized protein n=1 Tax=Corchorus capsularis TaxID=210143 RepID=A0A1R3HQF8_COCAP|nr:hypothetical protein CCACVL1_17690 [Corchorus capsularis]
MGTQTKDARLRLAWLRRFGANE